MSIKLFVHIKILGFNVKSPNPHLNANFMTITPVFPYINIKIALEVVFGIAITLNEYNSNSKFKKLVKLLCIFTYPCF